MKEEKKGGTASPIPKKGGDIQSSGGEERKEKESKASPIHKKGGRKRDLSIGVW